MVVSCHFDIIPGFLDQVTLKLTRHLYRTPPPPHNTQPSIKDPLPALIDARSQSWQPQTSLSIHVTGSPHIHPFCHWGAPGPRACPANDTTALCESGARRRHGGCQAGRCHAMSEGRHCPSGARVEVGSFPQEVKVDLLKGADRRRYTKGARPSPLGRCQGPPGDQHRLSAHWWPFSNYPLQPHIWAAPTPAQLEDGTCVPLPAPVLAGLSDPPGLWGEEKLQAMLLAGKRVLTWAGQQ